MNSALIKRRAANLAPAGNGRIFKWYAEALTTHPQPNAGLAPDGSNTATLITANTTSNPHYIYAFTPDHAPSTELNLPYTFSVYVKSAGWRYVRVAYQWYYTPHYLNLDLLTGAYTVPPVGNVARPRAHRVEVLPGGWYRVSITEASSQGQMNPSIALVDVNTNMSVPGDGISGVLLWGFQVNRGGPAPYNPALSI